MGSVDPIVEKRSNTRKFISTPTVFLMRGLVDDSEITTVEKNALTPKANLPRTCGSTTTAFTQFAD